MNRLNWTIPTTVTRRQSEGISGIDIKISCSEGWGQDRNNETIEEEREREREREVYFFVTVTCLGGFGFGVRRNLERKSKAGIWGRERERETMVYQKKNNNKK